MRVEIHDPSFGHYVYCEDHDGKYNNYRAVESLDPVNAHWDPELQELTEF